MPLPTRDDDESYDEFITRCMGDDMMVDEYPDESQRRAVCERQARASVQFISAPGEVTIEAAAGDGQARLPRFRMIAYTGQPMWLGGWKYAAIVDLDRLTIPSQQRPIRFGHDMYSGVGHTDSIRVEGGQLVVTGVISRDTPAAREVVAAAQNGFPWQASISALVEEYELLKANKKMTVNGREVSGPLYVVTKATLGEISFVDLGADDNTSVTLAARAVDRGDENMEQEKETHEDTNIEEMAALFAGKYPEIEARAIEEGWDIARAKREIRLAELRAQRPSGPAIQSGASSAMTADLLTAGCLIASRIERPERFCDATILEAASRRWRRGLGLYELLVEAASANGYTGRGYRDTRAVMRYAFRPDLEAGWSSIDIGGILSNVANKFLLDGFFAVEQTWRNICTTRNVPDFKTVTSYRLIGNDTYEKVAPGGEIKHGTLGEESFSNKADTYGLMLSIDRTQIINDDLGAITAVPRKLGAGAGRKLNNVFWTIFMDNASFFTAARGNYLTGADTALSIDGLTKAEVAFMDQVDADGQPIGIMPAILLVPTALSAVGSQLYKSMELRDTAANAKYPVANPHQGKFRVETTSYLGNVSYTGASAKAWYLLANPTDMAVIEVAFLNGQEAPTIETADADFSTLGIQMRGYHDFGVALQDYRAGVKMKGEA